MMKMFWVMTTIALLTVPSSATAQDPATIAEGATVWARNCVRCHNARASAERNDRDWATIVAHMRARANLTRSQATKVEAFLTATNGPELARSDTRAADPVAPAARNDGSERAELARRVLALATAELRPDELRALVEYLESLRRP